MKSKAFRLPMVGLLALIATLSVSAHDTKGKELRLKGEVVGLQCYIVHDSIGKGHATCAEACINNGLPIGFLAEDGKLYLLLGSGHDSLKGEVAALAGQTVAITATLLEKNGMHALQLKKIESDK